VRKGWGDFYEWNRSGNYVPFPTSNDGSPKGGYYLLRATVNPLGLLIETNERDNVSYALIRVFNDGRVQLLERGYGRDPWNGPKEILTESP
jgi:hypothetical protein